MSEHAESADRSRIERRRCHRGVLASLSATHVEHSVSDGHAVQSVDGGVHNTGVFVLEEAVALALDAVHILHQMEGSQRTVDLQQLDDVVLGEIVRETAAEDLVRAVWHLVADRSR